MRKNHDQKIADDIAEAENLLKLTVAEVARQAEQHVRQIRHNVRQEIWSARRKQLGSTTDAAVHSGLTWDQSARLLTFYASTFERRPDKTGDIVDRHAWDKWLARWTADPLAEYPNTKGKLPIIWSHTWSDVKQVLGWADPSDVYIDAKGLLISAHLFDTEEAKRVWEVARDMGLAASFSYELTPNGEHREKIDGESVNVLTEFSRVLEAGPCSFGAEPNAGTRSVKSTDQLLAEVRDIDRLYTRAKDVDAGVTAESNTVGAGESTVVAADYPVVEHRCVTCGRYSMVEEHPAPRGLFGFAVCQNEDCQSLIILPKKQAKSLDESTIVARCKATAAWFKKNCVIVSDELEREVAAMKAMAIRDARRERADKAIRAELDAIDKYANDRITEQELNETLAKVAQATKKTRGVTQSDFTALFDSKNFDPALHDDGDKKSDTLEQPKPFTWTTP